jgi:hypothetical protein
MFVLAVLFLTFQFVGKILQWQKTQADKRDGTPKTAEAVLAEIVTTLGSVTTALGSVSTALNGMNARVDKIADQTDELHEVHLGPKALDDNLRPKWWSDRDEMQKMRVAIESMNKRLSSIERSLPGAATRPRSSDSLRDMPAAVEPKKV